MKNKKNRIAVAIGGLLLSTSFAANAGWTIKDLGTFGGTISAAYAINNSGQVAGIVGCCTGDIVSNAFITGADGIGLTSIGSFNTWALGINDSGQVVGVGSDNRAFITGANGTGLTYIAPPSSNANDINNSGQVVGSMYFPGTLYPHAYITGPNGSDITDLGTLSGVGSAASGINNLGQVTGYYYTNDGFSHGFITDNDGAGIRDLGNLGGGESAGSKINDLGQVVGWSTTEAGGLRQAFITGPDGVGMTGLGVMGAEMSEAYSINNLGEVVGYAGFGPECLCSPDAFLYSHGVMVNLTRLDEVQSTGWSQIYARDINDQGQIIGWGMIGGKQHAFLLSGADEEFFRTYVPVPVPIPEPTTYAMLLTGLGLFGYMGRRQAKQ